MTEHEMAPINRRDTGAPALLHWRRNGAAPPPCAPPCAPVARAPARMARPHGAPNGAPHGAPRRAPLRHSAKPAPTGEVVDAEYVIYRLEEAGSALLALPHTGYSTRLRSSALDVVRSAIEGYGWEEASPRLRPPVPDATRITRMDEAMGWIPLIPRDRYVLRRIVGARSLVSPTTERHLFSWRRLAALLGADHKAIQRWHAQGIDMIVAAVNAG